MIKNDPSKYTYTEIILFEDKNQMTVIDQTKKLNISMFYIINKTRMTGQYISAGCVRCGCLHWILRIQQ